MKFQPSILQKSPSTDNRLPTTTFFHSSTLALAGILVLILLVYAGGFDNSFVNWDDDRIIYNNSFIKELNWENLKAIFTRFTQPVSDMYLPVRTLSHLLEWSLWGGWAPGYFGVNLLLFALAIVLLFRLLRQIGFSERITLLTVGLWALHPLRVESVTWLSARKDVLALCFILLAWLGIVRLMQGRSRRPWFLSLGSLLAFGLAMLTKLTSAAFPLILGLYLVFFHLPRTREQQLRFWGISAGVLLPMAVLVLILYQLSLAYGPETGLLAEYPGGSLTTSILTSLRTQVAYLALSFAPIGLCHYYVVPSSFDLWQTTATANYGAGPTLDILALPAFYPTLGFSLLGLVLIWGCWKFLRTGRYGRVLFAFMTYVATFLPVSGILGATYIRMADRYTLLPHLGLFLLIALVIDWVWQRLPHPGLSRLVLAACVAALLGLAGTTFARNQVWDNSVALWQDGVAKNPNWYRSWYFLGKAHYSKGRAELARQAFRQGLRLKPGYFWLQDFNAKACALLDRPAERLASLVAAKEITRYSARQAWLQRQIQQELAETGLSVAISGLEVTQCIATPPRLEVQWRSVRPLWVSLLWLDGSGRCYRSEARFAPEPGRVSFRDEEGPDRAESLLLLTDTGQVARIPYFAAVPVEIAPAGTGW